MMDFECVDGDLTKEILGDDALSDDNWEGDRLSYTAKEQDVGVRIDKLISSVVVQFSRNHIQKLIQGGDILVNEERIKPKYTLKIGDVIVINDTQNPHSDELPENIPLDIVYEDETVVVINKPASMVVHKGAGNRSGTLVNALLYHYPNQAHLPRAGLVHRIDKGTTGLLIVAKTAQAQLHLSEQLKNKTVYRHYQCVVAGTQMELARHQRIDAPIGRHPTYRTKMTVIGTGKPAVTHIKKITPLNHAYSLLDIALETGRTHQIRVHLSSIGYPLVGDKTYHKPIKKSGLDEATYQFLVNFPRQALHAYRLGFIHPITNKPISVHCPLPCDMRQLIECLKTA